MGSWMKWKTWATTKGKAVLYSNVYRRCTATTEITLVLELLGGNEKKNIWFGWMISMFCKDPFQPIPVPVWICVAAMLLGCAELRWMVVMAVACMCTYVHVCVLKDELNEKNIFIGLIWAWNTATLVSWKSHERNSCQAAKTGNKVKWSIAH